MVELDTSEFRQRLIDRYTSEELVELLNIPVEDIIDNFGTRIYNNAYLFEDVLNPEDDNEFENE